MITNAWFSGRGVTVGLEEIPSEVGQKGSSVAVSMAVTGVAVSFLVQLAPKRHPTRVTVDTNRIMPERANDFTRLV